jgi:hypothetical protein
MSFSEEEEPDAGDFLSTDEGTRLVRAQRLARARKNALAVSLGRVDERETIHRKLKSSSVRAEVTQLSEQLKKKEGDLKEARLYIQRLELRLAENKDKSKEIDRERERETENGEKERKEIGDVKKRLRQVERMTDNLKQTTSLELTRLLQLISGAERLVDTPAVHVQNSPNPIHSKSNPAAALVGEFGNGRVLQGLLLKARHSLENLLRTVSQSSQVQDNDNGPDSSTSIAAAAAAETTSEYANAKCSLSAGDLQDSEFKGVPFVSAQAQGSDHTQRKDSQGAGSPSHTASLAADATSFINARRTILQSNARREEGLEHGHGQQWLVGSLLEMCQVLESENVRLKQQGQGQQQPSSAHAAAGVGVGGASASVGGAMGHFTPQEQQQQVHTELQQMRRLVSHYRTAILRLQQDHSACLEELASERELSAAVKAQLSALHRRDSSSSSSGSSSLRGSKWAVAPGTNRAKQSLPDHRHQMASARAIASSSGLSLGASNATQPRRRPTSASTSPTRGRSAHSRSGDFDASTDLNEDRDGGGSRVDEAPSGRNRARDRDQDGKYCSSPLFRGKGNTSVGDTDHLFPLHGDEKEEEGDGEDESGKHSPSHTSRAPLTRLPDAQLIQSELQALDQEIAALREKLRQAALEKTSAIMSHALGAAVGDSSAGAYAKGK